MGLGCSVCQILCCRSCNLKGERYGKWFPKNAQQLEKAGKEWLTEALCTEGVISPEHTITSVSFSIPNIEGMMSEMRVATIEYGKGAPASYPSSAMIKFAPELLKTRLVTDLFHLSEQEYYFYKFLRPSMPMRTPDVYFSDMNFTTKNFCIIMEMLDDVEFPNQKMMNPDDLTLPDALLVMQSLARLHARQLGDRFRAEEMPYVNSGDDPRSKLLGPVARFAWKKVKRKMQGAQKGKPLPAWTYAFPKSVADMLEEDGFRLVGSGEVLSLITNCASATIIHGDPRLDNHFFYKDADGRRAVGLLDWQLFMRTSGVVDLGWFIATSCSPSFQQKHEVTMLDCYFDTLAAEGSSLGAGGRAEWEELYDFSFLLTMSKLIVSAEGCDTSKVHVVALANQMLENAISGMMRRNTSDTVRKAAAGDLIVQRNNTTSKRPSAKVAPVGSSPSELNSAASKV